MKISNLVADKRTVTVEYPGIDGFKVSLCYLGRDELVKIRERNMHFKFNPATGNREESVDNDAFLKDYTEKVIIGWTGLKVKHLEKLFPAETEGLDPNEEVDYSDENAYTIVRESVAFDQWLTDCMTHVEMFNRKEEEAAAKN